MKPPVGRHVSVFACLRHIPVSVYLADPSAGYRCLGQPPRPNVTPRHHRRRRRDETINDASLLSDTLWPNSGRLRPTMDTDGSGTIIPRDRDVAACCSAVLACPGGDAGTPSPPGPVQAGGRLMI